MLHSRASTSLAIYTIKETRKQNRRSCACCQQQNNWKDTSALLIIFLDASPCLENPNVFFFLDINKQNKTFDRPYPSWYFIIFLLIVVDYNNKVEVLVYIQVIRRSFWRDRVTITRVRIKGMILSRIVFRCVHRVLTSKIRLSGSSNCLGLWAIKWRANFNNVLQITCRYSFCLTH